MTYIIGNVVYTIIYKEIKIGDTVLDKNNDSIYTATIEDADDLGWIVINSNELS